MRRRTATQTTGGTPGASDTAIPDVFSTGDWALLAGVALTWGSSFVWIEEGLEAFDPPVVTLLRLLFGTAALAAFPRARARVQRDDLPRVALLAVLWMAAPFLLFPVAQQWIDSSLAGMINGGVPIFAGAVAAVASRRLPAGKQIAGLLLGFAGVVVVSLPAVAGARATALGAALVLLATLSYGIAINVAVPLQQRYGSLPVLLRTQLFALAIVLVPGVAGLPGSSFAWPSLGAMVPLGCLGTGLAFVWMATLVGRVGAARGSVTIYFVPLVAVALGALVRDESIAMVSLAGTAMVLVGAFLTSRGTSG